jgi:hypothetical protein
VKIPRQTFGFFRAGDKARLARAVLRPLALTMIAMKVRKLSVDHIGTGEAITITTVVHD